MKKTLIRLAVLSLAIAALCCCKNQNNSESTEPEPAATEAVEAAEAVEAEAAEAVEAAEAEIIKAAEEALEGSDSVPFALVETKPAFEGGDANSFAKYVANNLNYPEDAIEAGIEGRVMVQFTVGTDGKIGNVKVIRGVDSKLDEEAVRVVSNAPAWTPGKNGDKVVPVTYTMPVVFKLK